MKRIFALLLLFSGLAYGQGGNTLTLQGSGVPPGTCAFLMVYINTANGDYYTCNVSNGLWQLMTTATTVITGVASVTGTANQIAVTGSTGDVIFSIPASSRLDIGRITNLTSNGMVTTSGGTGALSVTATTGSGSVTLATSPTIVTPTIAKIANLTTNGVVTAASGDGTLGSVAPSTSGNVLTSNGSAWISSAPNVSSTAGGDLSGTLPNPTVAKVNGVVYPASPSLYQIPVITSLTGGGVATYKTLPDCTDTGGQHLNYTQSTTTFSCGTSGGGGGGGSGTVSSATSGNLTYYAATGTTVSGNSNATLDAAGNLTVTSLTTTGSGSGTFDLIDATTGKIVRQSVTANTISADRSVIWPNIAGLVGVLAGSLTPGNAVIIGGSTPNYDLVDAGAPPVTSSSTTTLTNKTLASTTDVLGGVTVTMGSDATGDIYYRNSSGVLTKLAIGSTGALLNVAAGLPAWDSTTIYQKIVRQTPITSSATPTPVCTPNGKTIWVITALATAPTFAAPTGSCNHGDLIDLTVISDSSAHAESFNGAYRVGDVAFPTTTTANKTQHFMFSWNGTATKWDLLAFSDNY